MDKFMILSKGNSFGAEGFDEVYGYVTSQENATLLCDEWNKNGGSFYYLKNNNYNGQLNLDMTVDEIKELKQ